MATERKRLDEARENEVPWKKWGPYLSERQWGTVREDYSDFLWEKVSMLLKQADSKEPQIRELQRLIQIAPSSIKPKIEHVRLKSH